jgi:hypothetical protein
MHAQAAMQLPPGGGSGNSIGSGAENTVVPMQVELGGRPAKGGGLLSSACGGARAHPCGTSIGLGGTPVRLTSSPGVAEHGGSGGHRRVALSARPPAEFNAGGPGGWHSDDDSGAENHFFARARGNCKNSKVSGLNRRIADGGLSLPTRDGTEPCGWRRHEAEEGRRRRVRGPDAAQEGGRRPRAGRPRGVRL